MTDAPAMHTAEVEEDENREHDEDDEDDDDESISAAVPAPAPARTVEALEARVRQLEAACRRATVRRSRLVRLDRKVRAWQESLDRSAAVASLGVTVEHVMESMFGLSGLQALSAAQISALEDLHFAALRHLSDARVAAARRELRLELRLEQADRQRAAAAARRAHAQQHQQHTQSQPQQQEPPSNL